MPLKTCLLFLAVMIVSVYTVTCIVNTVMKVSLLLRRMFGYKRQKGTGRVQKFRI